MSGTNDKKTPKVSPQAAIAQGVKNKPAGNKVDTRRQRQGSGQGLGSRVKSKPDIKVSKQDDKETDIAVEEFIDTFGGNDAVKVYEEFKELLRLFRISSMKELRKRLQNDAGGERSDVSGKPQTRTEDKKKEILKATNQKQVNIGGKEQKQKSQQDTDGEIKLLQRDLTNANEENKKLQDQIQAVVSEKTLLQRDLADANDEKKKFQEKMQVFEKEKKVLEEKLASANENINALEQSHGHSRKGADPKLKEKSKGKNSENDRTRSSSAQKEREKLNSELDKLKSEKEKAEAEVQELNSKLKEALHEKDLAEIQAQKEIQDLKSKSEEATKEMNKYLQPDTKKLKDEIDQLKNRLSQLAGSKLTEGNPAIADLSDTNRPINLGEKFSELYDNQWTDAFEELSEKEKKDEKVISELFKTVTEAYEFCTKQSEDFHHKLKDLMKQFSMDPKKLPTEVSKQIKDYRKGLSVSLLQDVQEGFCKKQKKIKESQVKMYAYARRCIAVCWFMTVQDPPVFMDANPGNSVFDNDKFRAYTRTGKQIDYLVWPALYLHAEGPLLSKGVAQGK